MLQTKAETGELSSISVGSWWGNQGLWSVPQWNPAPGHTGKAQWEVLHTIISANKLHPGSSWYLQHFSDVFDWFTSFSLEILKYCIIVYITAKRKSTWVTKSHHPKRNAKWSRQWIKEKKPSVNWPAQSLLHKKSENISKSFLTQPLMFYHDRIFDGLWLSEIEQEISREPVLCPG